MKSSENSWTEIIKPKRGWLDINLKEIWRYRDLIILFVRRDFVSLYNQTILGPLWLFIQPLFNIFIFYFVFKRIVTFETGIDNLYRVTCIIPADLMNNGVYTIQLYFNCSKSILLLSNPSTFSFEVEEKGRHYSYFGEGNRSVRSNFKMEN